LNAADALGWERLASVLEDNFAPMLPMILPRIMKSASIPPDDGKSCSVKALIKADADPYYCSEECKSKAEALTALWFYASNVPAGFTQYLRPVWQIVLDSLNILFPAQVKKVSSSILS
jgi:hypothetical protein